MPAEGSCLSSPWHRAEYPGNELGWATLSWGAPSPRCLGLDHSWVKASKFTLDPFQQPAVLLGSKSKREWPVASAENRIPTRSPGSCRAACRACLRVWASLEGKAGRQRACVCKMEKPAPAHFCFINCFNYLVASGHMGGIESCCQCRRHRRRGFDPWVRKILLE